MSGDSPDITIRPGRLSDVPQLVEFNCRLAFETEHLTLDQPTVEQGVTAALRDPSKARYFVACVDDVPIGQIMHTWEWSDWRNGSLWWLQSVYVHPDYRGRGVFRSLFRHVHQLACDDPQVVGLRLYVERENAVAQSVYESLGLTAGGYLVMEQTPLVRSPS